MKDLKEIEECIHLVKDELKEVNVRLHSVELEQKIDNLKCCMNCKYGIPTNRTFYEIECNNKNTCDCLEYWQFDGLKKDER